MPVSEIVIICGYPGAGKTSIVGQYNGYCRLNRDTIGCSLDDIAKQLDAEIRKGGKKFVLDNTYGTIKSRSTVVAVGKKHGIPVSCVHLNTSIDDAMSNVCIRMIANYGCILGPADIAKSKDPSLVPAAAIFAYRKTFEKPTIDEGFAKVETVKFVRRIDPSYTGGAYIFDFDGTLRTCKNSKQKYPVDPSDVVLLPGRKTKLASLHKQGHRLLGVSNQGDIGRGKVSLNAVKVCFDRTIELLGVPIEVSFCPHSVPPISCFCRKPQSGLFIDFIERYKLDRKEVYFIGDMTSDKTAAARVGIHYIDQEEFFK